MNPARVNTGKDDLASKPKAGGKSRASKPRKPAPKARPVKLLSGGNPQIAKADGDAPGRAYIAAMPGWIP